LNSENRDDGDDVVGDGDGDDEKKVDVENDELQEKEVLAADPPW